jgi:hypothetical protein
MDDPKHDSQHPPTRDHLEAAIEASCETLVALQVISDAAPDDDGLESQTRRAIGSLRRAISELRTERAERASAVAFGFVVGNRGP